MAPIWSQIFLDQKLSLHSCGVALRNFNHRIVTLRERPTTHDRVDHNTVHRVYSIQYTVYRAVPQEPMHSPVQLVRALRIFHFKTQLESVF